MPESQCTQSLRDGFAELGVFDQALARLECIVQKSFRNLIACMIGVVIDGRVKFGLRRPEKNCLHATRRFARRARA